MVDEFMLSAGPTPIIDARGSSAIMDARTLRAYSFVRFDRMRISDPLRLEREYGRVGQEESRGISMRRQR